MLDAINKFIDDLIGFFERIFVNGWLLIGFIAFVILILIIIF